MKILFTGGGTGGHFYPIIAVAEAVHEEVHNQKLPEPELFFMSTSPYDQRALFENHISFIPINAGKQRRYFSFLNFIDFFKTAFGILIALWKVFFLYPDVIFTKGGYASFPVVVAARILRIPVLVHESDIKPGRANEWAGKFAKRVAVSYPEAMSYFPKDKTAMTGIPIRRDVMRPIKNGAREYLNLKEEDIPTILVLGGSQGAKRINQVLVDALPEIVKTHYVIHQTGLAHHEDVSKRAEVVLSDSQFAYRYKSFGYLNKTGLAMSAGAADVVVTRAGSTAIAEVASWNLPSIVIPIPESVSHDQTKNAVAYAKTGAAILLEEKNLTPNILLSEIKRITENDDVSERMRSKTKEWGSADAGRLIAKEIIEIALEHEK